MEVLTKEWLGLILSRSKERWLSSRLFFVHLENDVSAFARLPAPPCCLPVHVSPTYQVMETVSGQHIALLFEDLSRSPRSAGNLDCSVVAPGALQFSLASRWGHKNGLNQPQEGDCKERYFEIPLHLSGVKGWGDMRRIGVMGEQWILFLSVPLTIAHL